MIWQNPWAWGGLVVVALPVLIHLLGRGHARVQKFPTLRFLEASRLMPTRRTRVHDWVLLAVRVGILAAAVAALAQPLLVTAGRKRALDRGLARVIVVDTSASMYRTTPAGERGFDVARREAKRLATEAQTSTVVESATPGRSLAGAAAWLAKQEGHTELVVLSDFQLGAFNANDLTAIPAGSGIRLSRIGVSPGAVPADTRLRVGGADVVARITPLAERTEVEWITGAAARASEDVLVLASAADRARADAAMTAARSAGARLPLDSTRAIAVIFPRYEQLAGVLKTLDSVRTPWMVDALTRLNADSIALSGSFEGQVGGRHRLLLLSAADAGSLESARLLTAAIRAVAGPSNVAELEPAALSDSVLASWQRPAAVDAPSRPQAADTNGPSDARFFWALALLLLLLETRLRRAPEYRLPNTDTRLPNAA